MEQKDLERGKRLEEVFNYLLKKGHVNTQKDFANKVGCTPGQISKAMKGMQGQITEPLIKKVYAAFAEIFNLNYLLEGEGTLLKDSFKTEPPSHDKETDFESLYKKALERIIELERENAVLLFQLQQYTNIEKEKTAV